MFQVNIFFQIVLFPYAKIQCLHLNAAITTWGPHFLQERIKSVPANVQNSPRRD